MGIREKDGFTIIEVTLFLAVTGLLVLMVLIGTGSSLNAQRYRDSVESFKSLVQEQYSSLSNVFNGRDNNWSCSNTNAAPNEGGAGTQPRGQTECVLVGRYLRIERGDITTYNVLAVERGQTQSSDIPAMANDFAYSVSQTEAEDEKMEWGTSIAWASGGGVDQLTPQTPREFSMLVIRSPRTGQVYTFTSNAIVSKTAMPPATIPSMIRAGASVPGQAGRMICVHSDGLFSASEMGVYIAPFASSANAVQTHTNQNSDGIRC